MKRSDLTQIIKEEVNRHLMIEGIIDTIMMAFLSPKIKKEVSKLKKTAEFKELLKRLQYDKEQIEMYSDRAEKALAKCKETQAKSKKMGVKTYPCFEI